MASGSHTFTMTRNGDEEYVTVHGYTDRQKALEFVKRRYHGAKNIKPVVGKAPKPPAGEIVPDDGDKA